MIRDNTSDCGVGGGAFGEDGASPTFTDCVFINNVGDLGGGGAYFNYDCLPSLYGCTFAGNYSAMGAGLAVLNDSYLTMHNTVVAFNLAGEALYCTVSSGAELICCNLYGNAEGDWIGCIADQLGVDGNISLDPLFCDKGAWDVHLRGDSPCLPDYNPGCGLIGARGQGCESSNVAESRAQGTRLLIVPNPFTRGSSVSYRVPEKAGSLPVELGIVDVRGRLVRRLVDGQQSAGQHFAAWDGTDRTGRPVVAGVYFYRLRVADENESQAVILLR